MRQVDRSHAYELISRLASLDEANGLPKDRAVLLLWFLRGAVGLEDLDAYDYICDGDHDQGVDALYLEERQGEEDELDTLVIYQSYFTESPKDIGPTKLERLIAAANHFKTAGALQALLDGELEAPLRRLIKDFDLHSKLAGGAIETGRLRIRLVLVTTGVLGPKAIAHVNALNAVEGEGYLTVYDLRRLDALAEVIAVPEAEVDRIEIASVPSERLVVTVDDVGNRVAVLPARATDIVTWNGLTDRKLFELNVRGELKKNRVSGQLDSAVRRTSDHRDFLASHNGLTITCDSFDDAAPDKVVAERPSIVNGAQSSMAFLRGHNGGQLTDELRVFIKLVEVKGRPQFAGSVSSRSNTQNAVNPRNLVSNTGPQRRLVAEFADRHPGVYYEVKPDLHRTKQMQAARRRIISNDDAAQLLCAVYVQEPWLAVKRTSLFEADDYPRIFNESIHAEHILLLDELAQMIEGRKSNVPARYLKSWKLTRLVLIYLLSQVMRADDSLQGILSAPAAALEDLDKLRSSVAAPLGAALLTLSKRQDRHDREGKADDFRVDFKRTDVLTELRNSARENYLTMLELQRLGG